MSRDPGLMLAVLPTAGKRTICAPPSNCCRIEGLRFCVGNAQTLIPGISYSPYRNPEAWECASASGFFLGDHVRPASSGARLGSSPIGGFSMRNGRVLGAV